jgi:Ca-activated chloride channel family protein
MLSATATLPLLFILASPAYAGDGPSSPPHSREKETRGAKPESSIRVDVNLALIPVSVVDNHGRNVTGLERGNFRLLDGKEPRPIASFSREDQPVSVGLIFDCSSSMRDKFLLAREAPAQLYQQLNSGDESFLITVSDQPVLRTGLTANFGELQSALLFTSPRGSTALIDGVYFGLSQIKKAHNPRRALIVVSDGGDNNSRYTFPELRKIAMEANTAIFSIGLHQAPATAEEEHGPALLQELAYASGGIDFPIRRADQIADIMSKIGMALHNEYVLGYYPPSDAPSGKYRRISVEVRAPSNLPPLRVFARSGYYVPER